MRSTQTVVQGRRAVYEVSGPPLVYPNGWSLGSHSYAWPPWQRTARQVIAPALPGFGGLIHRRQRR